jgi:hypothetical protein
MLCNANVNNISLSVVNNCTDKLSFLAIVSIEVH